MDSLTQIVLGAAVGETLLGKHIGNKALLLGAIAGTLPDLDVLAKLVSTDPIFEIQTHRAYTHSVFTHFILSFPLAWLSSRFSKAQISRARWYWFWFLGLFTHALLDCCTTYGTRLFLPFSHYQVGFNNISVIDPLYTIPWLLLLISLMFFKRNTPARNFISKTGWILSSAYMLLTFGLKIGVHSKFKQSLATNNIQYQNLNTTPTIFNAILWAGIAYNQDSIAVAEYSYMRPSMPITWVKYKRNLQLQNPYASQAMTTSTWFANEQYFFESHGSDTARMFQIKFGRGNFLETNPEKAFMFYTDFFKDKNGKVAYKQLNPRTADFDFKQAFRMLFWRIGLIKQL